MDVNETYDDSGAVRILVKSEKFKEPFEVYKPKDGFALYMVRSTASGSSPKELSGKYTSSVTALRELVKYLENAKVSKTVARDTRADKRDKERKANATKGEPNNKDNVQQRTVD